MFSSWLLSSLIWVPILGSIVVLATGNKDKSLDATRWVAMMFAMATMALCIPLYVLFNPETHQMQFVETHHWLPFVNAGYNLGVDGISVLFIILNCFTNLIVILAAWRGVKTKVAQYMAVFLLAAGITNGVFAATDSMLFYFFWEAALIPMYIGIGVWGGKNRAYAAIKFFLYTFLGSIFMLIAFIFMYFKSGSFAIADFEQLRLTQMEQNLIFLAFLAAFSVKIPMWPVHTWLPDAHTEAPAGGSVVLAALMLKMGAYGFIRFSLPIVPGVNESLDWLLIALSLVAVVYVGYASIVQKDVKRLIAYSSISHMGIVTLGLFMVFMIIGRTGDKVDAMLSVQGAIFQMISHGFSSGALFIGVGFLYYRYQSRIINDFSGVAKSMPIFAAFYMLFAMTNVGLPGTSGFVGEFMVILSAFKAHFWLAFFAAMTLILAPAYTLWMYQRVFFGEVKNKTIEKLEDITGVEIVVFVLLAIPIIVFGLYPEPILHLSHATTGHFVDHIINRLPAGTY